MNNRHTDVRLVLVLSALWFVLAATAGFAQPLLGVAPTAGFPDLPPYPYPYGLVYTSTPPPAKTEPAATENYEARGLRLVVRTEPGSNRSMNVQAMVEVDDMKAIWSIESVRFTLVNAGTDRPIYAWDGIPSVSLLGSSSRFSVPVVPREGLKLFAECRVRSARYLPTPGSGGLILGERTSGQNTWSWTFGVPLRTPPPGIR